MSNMGKTNVECKSLGVATYLSTPNDHLSIMDPTKLSSGLNLSKKKIQDQCRRRKARAVHLINAIGRAMVRGVSP